MNFVMEPINEPNTRIIKKENLCMDRNKINKPILDDTFLLSDNLYKNEDGIWASTGKAKVHYPDSGNIFLFFC
jgi:hypothetical protein